MNASMLIKSVLLCVATTAALHGQILLSDTFTGGTLNSSLWTTILPTGSSSVVQSGGVVTTTARGILATANQFSSPLVISGTFTMQSSVEHFNVAFRTDLSTAGAGSSFERAGMFVSFSNDGDQVSIQQFTSASDHATLASATFLLNSGQAYSFSITDTGSNVTLAINGVDQITASSTFSTGNFIGFYSREFSSTATAIDSITISAIPEPSTYVVIAGLGALCFVGYCRRWALRF